MRDLKPSPPHLAIRDGDGPSLNLKTKKMADFKFRKSRSLSSFTKMMGIHSLELREWKRKSDGLPCFILRGTRKDGEVISIQTPAECISMEEYTKIKEDHPMISLCEREDGETFFLFHRQGDQGTLRDTMNFDEA